MLHICVRYFLRLPDARGHGATRSVGRGLETVEDTSLSQMTQDCNDILAVLNRRNLILVGHSMGGAVAVNVSFTNKVFHILGTVVIDCVEG